MKTLQLILVITCVCGASSVAHAGGYPDKPLRMIVGFPPGGPADTVARLLGQPISHALGQTIVVENAPGAAGSIAGARLAKATPDGYTLGLVTEAQVLINPSLYKLAYDPTRDYSAISLIATAPYLLVVHNGVAAKNVRELVALAQAQPASLTFASPGSGSTPHVVTELFKAAAAIELRHVPYKGVGPALPDLLAGRVTLMFSPVATGLSLVREGKLRALAVTSAKRTSVAPDVPALAEAGYPDFDVSGWLGLVCPLKTPKPTISKLYLEVTRALSAGDVRLKLVNLGLEPIGSSPEALSTMIAPGRAKWAKVIKDSGIRPD